jgi:ABC-type iron transport system FetAB ATPase subunit
MRLAAEANVDFWADEARCRAIVQFQDRATQAREFIDFCRSSLGMVYNAMFSRNPQPKIFTDLMEKFKSVRDIHSFVKAQMVAGEKFAIIWLMIHHPKIDLGDVAKGVLLKSSKKKIKLDRHIEAVSGPAEKMIEKLLEVDSGFFKNFRYDEST